MLNLDGAKFDLTTRELVYTLPEPFGPERGEAHITILAKPASAQNPEFKARIEKLMNDAKVKDVLRQKRYRETDDVDEFVRVGEEDAKTVRRKILELNYDECVEDWSTNVQNNGKDLEPTRENFVALAEFPHPVLAKIFDRFNRDLTEHSRWQEIGDREVERETAGNSSGS